MFNYISLVIIVILSTEGVPYRIRHPGQEEFPGLVMKPGKEGVPHSPIKTENQQGKTDIYSVSDEIIAQDGQFPYQVSIQYTTGKHYCSGSIINKRWILTTADCVNGKDPDILLVVTGTNRLNESRMRYKVEKYFTHEQFNLTLVVNNIAVVKVKQDIEMGPKVQPIKLSTDAVEVGQLLVVSGWGSISYPNNTQPNELRYTVYKLISIDECKKTIEPGSVHPTQTEICALKENEVGGCMGDGGDPLVRANTFEQVGIFSWFLPCTLGKPDVYTRIASYYDWIMSHIAENVTKQPGKKH